MWRGVLHHICNEHTWQDMHGSAINSCTHDLPADPQGKEYLHPSNDCQVLKQLTSVVLDQTLLKRAAKLITYRYLVVL
jgi:hypothetical protein